MLFSGPQGSEQLAETIWKTLETAYFETLSQEDAYDRFEEALRIVNLQLAAENELKNQDFLHEYAVLLALFAENELHVSVVGAAEAYLIRKNKLSIISEGLAPKEIKDDLFVNIASGEIEHDDKVLFATDRFLRHATSAQLAEMLAPGVLEGSESLKELLRLADDHVSFILFHAHGASKALPFQEENLPKRDFFAPLAKNTIFANFMMRARQFWEKLKTGDQKHFLAAILGVLGIVVVISLIGSLFGQSQDAQYQHYKDLLTQGQRSLAEAEDQESLEQKDRANTTLNTVEQDLQEVLKSGLFRSEALALLNKTAEARDRINNITRISTPKELAVIKASKDQGTLRGIFEYAEEWFAFDTTGLARIVLDKVASTVAFPAGAQIQLGAPFSDKQKLVFSDGRNKIFEYDPESKKFSAAKTDDTAWKTHSLMTAYSKYIYLLSPGDKQIWKYEKGADAYGAATGYLDGEYDLSQAVSFTIDGNIFVFTKDGKLLKFFQGKQVEYPLSGTPEGALDGVSKIYTTENLDSLLLLNPKKSTVYVFTKGQKQLIYTHQIVLENIGVLQDFWVKEPKMLVVADETKLYEIPL